MAQIVSHQPLIPETCVRSQASPCGSRNGTWTDIKKLNYSERIGFSLSVSFHKYAILVFHSCRPLGRPRRRWVDNIRTDLKEVGCGYMDWIGLAQDRDRWRTLVSEVMNLRVP